jgi:Ser/Thr protein kinase RdoA (MazF antagonist)
MDYIDARPLNATMTGEEVLNGHHFERMGQTLARLHAVTSRGYGRPRGEQGEYQHFHDWLRNNAERHIAYVRQNNLLNENDYGSVGFACGTLVEFVQRNDSSVYCHNDFSVANVLDTIPLTVFDPDPIINHPYLDLARSIILIANAKIQIVDAADQLLHGYVSVAGPIDVAILRASLILQVYLKIPFWNETRQYAKVALVQAYLRQ